MKVMLLSMVIVSGFRFLNTMFVKEFDVKKEITGFLAQTICVAACIALVKVFF
jgi:ABC-type uncharacterized transport system permease subunit